ncbi:peroxiredoxin family protein [Pararhodonellum marinum]|uniref:peroxiredoxin family protein n=1 Tax=Pararhodonellum marinum TaxID=2755358 RepID=UPI001E2D2E7C|nr:peroxiredoxin family protein [Pararhodonellum marinum]
MIFSSFVFEGPDLWALFSKTRFTEKLNRELKMYFLYPNFPEELKALEGKQVQVSGFYIPLEVNLGNLVVLSKYPMAECFFCGGSGPESVLVAYLKGRPPKRLKTDDIITIKGTLKLNANDIEELNFILENAEILPNK